MQVTEIAEYIRLKKRIMATDDNTRHLRYILLLGEGGGLILRAILDRETHKTGNTLEGLLQPNERSLYRMTNDKQFLKLFPQRGTVDKNTWDISLLGTVILQLFEKTSLSKDESNDIRKLKVLRNDLLAHAASVSMYEDEFENAWKELAALLIKLSSGVDRNVHDKCQNFVKQFHTDPIDAPSATDILNKLSKFDEILADQLRTISEKLEGVIGKVDKIYNELPDIKQLLERMVHQGDNFQSFHVVGAKMDLRGPNYRLTILGETAIIGVFKSALNRTGVEKKIPDLTEEEISKLENSVIELLEEIKSKGGHFESIEKQCIMMEIKCTTCHGLLELLEYLESSKFSQRLRDMELVLEDIFKGVYHITFEITQDTLKKILDSLRGKPATEQSWTRPDVIGANDKDTEQGSATAVDTDIKNKGGKQTEQQPKAEQEVLGTNGRDKEQSSDTDIDPETIKIESNLAKENDSLLDNILDVCECSGDDDTNHVILLIGTVGAGKSSLINTLHKVLTGRYFIIAKQGRGVSQSVTGELMRYENCGISLDRVRDVHKRRKIQKIFKQLPQIVDFAGLGNVNTPGLSEILELLIGGFLPAGTAIQALGQYQMEYGVGAPKRIYSSPNPKWKVSKIVFMHSCTDKIPENLIECLKGVLEAVDPVKGQRKYKPELFFLTTKFDLAGDSSIHHVHSNSQISLADFEEVEKSIADKFNIGHRSYRWISITDSISVDSIYIQNLALKFLESVLEPGIPVQADGDEVLGRWKNIELVTMKLYNQIKRWFLFRQIQLNFTPANLLTLLLIAIAVMLAVWNSK